MKISDFCRTAAGGTPLKSNKAFYENGEIPWLLSGEVGNRDIFETKNYITQAGLNGSSAKIFPENSVLIAMYGATAGEVGILRCEAATNQAVCGIYPNDKVVPEYLYYFFLSHKDSLVAQAVGNAQPNISQQKIKDTDVPLLQISEQKRIVAILDQAFADIDQARALTEQNLKNARELFESYLQKLFSQRGEGWMVKTLCDVSENLDSKRVPITKRDRMEGDYPYYGASGIVDYIDSYIFDEDLLLVSEDGANLLARTYPIAFSATGKYWVNNHAHVLKFQNQWIQKFTEYYLNSISLEPYVSGMAQPKLNQRALNSIPVPSVSSEIAQNVVLKLSKLESELNTIDVIYREKLHSLGELKKSLLQKAFSGQLTKNREAA